MTAQDSRYSCHRSSDNSGLKIPYLYFYLAHIQLLSAKNRIFRVTPTIEAKVRGAIKQRPNTFPRVMAETQEALWIEISIAQIHKIMLNSVHNPT
jgi:hypothetical protein